jgi:hypothetical protein
MNDAGLPATAAADAQATTEGKVDSREASAPPLPAGAGVLPVIVMAIGGLITGITASAGLLALPSGEGTDFALHAIAKDQIDDAIISMGGQAPAAMVEEARQCKVPLAVLTVSADGSGTASAIRIRSGSFLSPSILLTPSPRRIAIPFPAPHATGKGMLFVEGAGQGVNVWLSPGQHYTKLEGPAAINVVWTPTKPC